MGTPPLYADLTQSVDLTRLRSKFQPPKKRNLSRVPEVAKVSLRRSPAYSDSRVFCSAQIPVRLPEPFSYRLKFTFAACPAPKPLCSPSRICLNRSAYWLRSGGALVGSTAPNVP